jgi:hypothetical protein
VVVRERWVQVGRKSPDDLSFVRPSPGRFPLNFLEDQTSTAGREDCESEDTQQQRARALTFNRLAITGTRL